MAGFRVAQLVCGIGPATAKRLLQQMEAAADPAAALLAFKPPAAAADEWCSFAATYAQLREAASPWPADIDLVNRWYLPQLRRIHDDAQVREADLAQLERIAAGYSSRERFLTELTLDPPDATSDESGPPHLDEDYLILSTIHSAKGQEWNSVSVLNVVDGCIPSDMATGNQDEIDEERRLLYVAMTRARQHLHLLVPQRFYITQQTPYGDRHLYGSLTRFIPPEVALHFESVAPALLQAADADAAAVAPLKTIDAAAQVRSLWS